MRFRRSMISTAMAMFAAVWVEAPTIARAQQATPPDTTQAGSSLADLARQSQQSGYALPDTLAASPRIGIRFTPTYINQMTGDVSSVGMRNVFQTNMTTPFGSIFNFNVSAEEKHYRLQNKRDENKQLGAFISLTS